MAEQEANEQRPNTPTGGEDNKEAGQNKRRRRRGKRRPAGERENSGGEGQEPSAERSANSEQKQQGEPSSESKSGTPEGKNSDGKASEGQRRRRPARRKKRTPKTEDQKSEAASTAPKSEEGAKSDEKSADKKPRGDRRDRRPSKGPNKEKKERAPRGSVLDRRKTRGDAVLDLPDDEPIIPVQRVVAAKTVDAYVKHLRGWQREVVMMLRNIIKGQASEASEDILWSQPVYSLSGPVCYIKAFSDHVNLGFWRGNEIEDEEERLVGELATMRHVTIRHVNEMNRELFEDYVRQAFRLNKEKGDPTV